MPQRGARLAAGPRTPHLRALPALPLRAGAAEREALRAAAAASAAQLGGLRQRFLAAATIDGTGGLKTTGVRWWLKYCVFARNVLPFTRLSAASPLAEKIEAEQLLMDFAIWLALFRPSGRVISARSIKKYISHVRAWHRRTFRTELCGDLDYSAVNDLMRGVCRLVAQPPRRERWGVRTQDLARALSLHLAGPGAEAANWAAALTVAFCGLLRGAEFALQPGQRFDASLPPEEQPHLMRSDVSFRRDASGAEYVVLMMRPAKGQPGRGKEVPLLLGGGGSLLDPVAALRRLWAADPVPPGELARTPLFRTGVRGVPLTVKGVRDTVRLLMGSLGLDPRRFGAHSLRIGGASAGLAAGMSAAALRAAGRWASDVYLLYARASKQAVRGIATVIGSTPFEDLERGEFVDEELMVTTADIAVGGARGVTVEQDLIDDALSDDDEWR